MAALTRPTGPPAAAVRELVRVEARLYLREPIAVCWALVFPPFLLVVLGLLPGFREPNPSFEGGTVLEAYVPILVVCSIVSTAVSVLPVQLATYRERGVLRRTATTPLGPGAVLLAQLVVHAVVSTVALGLVLAVGRTAYGIPLPGSAAGFLLGYLLTLAALLAVGATLGAVVASSRSASAAGMLLLFPLLFFAGLYVPIEVLPEAVQRIADVLPVGAAVTAMGEAADGSWPSVIPVAVLVGWAGLGAAVAVRSFRWQ